jgi:hypothetical protein
MYSNLTVTSLSRISYHDLEPANYLWVEGGRFRVQEFEGSRVQVKPLKVFYHFIPWPLESLNPV